jgi:hypothetical protein
VNQARGPLYSHATLLASAIALPLLLAAEDVPPVPLVGAVAVQPAAQVPGTAAEAPLRRDGESEVEAGATFRVEAAVPLADARLALYDAQGALVAADGKAEISSAGSWFTLAPSEPLRPGSSYVLRLEGAADREIRDLGGRRYRPLTFTLRATGEAPREPPPRKGKARRR